MLPLMKALGAEYPTRVSCLGTKEIQTDREVADTMQVTAEFPSGHMMLLVGSTVNEQGLQDMIRGHKATMYLGGDGLDLYPERPYIDAVEPFSMTANLSTEQHHAHEANFFKAIRGEEQPNCGIDLAVKAQTVISLAEVSYREKRMVDFDPKTFGGKDSHK